MGKALVHSIVVIESLSSGERQTGTELYCDVIKRYVEYYSKGDPIYHSFFKPTSKSDFLNVLEHVLENSLHYRRGLIIHIECHGLSDKAGLFLSDGSSILWEDLKVPLIKINTSIENELYLSMATCYGRYIHETIDISMKAPFSGFLSASSIIFEYETLENYSIFFEELIKTREIYRAVKTLSSRGSNLYYKDVKTVFDEAIQSSFEKFKNDPVAMKEFFDQCRVDYNRLKKPGYPDFDEMPVGPMFEIAKMGFVKKYQDNFLFGKYRK